MPQVGRLNVIERRMSRVLKEPPSVRTAAGVIVTATTVVVASLEASYASSSKSRVEKMVRNPSRS